MSAGSTDPGLSGCVPFRWSCQRCARCCSGGSGHVWLEPGEVEAMAAALSMQPSAFVERYTRAVRDPRSGEQRLSLREQGRGEGGRCALLAGATECSVYAARPAHCRRFPYWKSVLTDPQAFEAARATCPGIAVVASAELRERAFRALRELYAACAPAATASSDPCCFARCPTELYATGLEADHVASCAGTEPRTTEASGCELGAARPLSCRMAAAGAAAAEHAQARLRVLERELGYPAAYGRLDLLLRARRAAAPPIDS